MTGKGESILVVDDVEKQREIASTILSQLNYSVNTVACGEAAVEFIKHNEADLLVLDMIMDPGMDGLDVCRQLRRESDVPIMLVSALNHDQDIVRGLRGGADDYVVKPFTPQVLKEKIDQVLGVAEGAG